MTSFVFACLGFRKQNLDDLDGIQDELENGVVAPWRLSGMLLASGLI